MKPMCLFLLMVVVAVTAIDVDAHGIWFAQRSGELAMIYGEGAEDGDTADHDDAGTEEQPPGEAEPNDPDTITPNDKQAEPLPVVQTLVLPPGSVGLPARLWSAAFKHWLVDGVNPGIGCPARRRDSDDPRSQAPCRRWSRCNSTS